MRIVTPPEIEQVAWEGYLQPLGEVYRDVSLRPRVTLGEPVWWSAEQVMAGETGKAWTPPADRRRYALVRLACTLHPMDDSRARYTEATLTAYLRPRRGSGNVLAHDLYPQRRSTEDKGTFTIKLTPGLKFGEGVEVKLLEVGAEIEVRKVFPVIQGYGLGESNPYWKFAYHAADPLLGCQSVYLMTAAPPDADGVRLFVELIVNAENRFGPARWGLPETARANVSRLIASSTPDEGASDV